MDNPEIFAVNMLIYYTRKTARIKNYDHKQINFGSLKNYSAEGFSTMNYLRTMTKLINLIQEVMPVIDKLVKANKGENKGVMSISQDCLDIEIIEKITDRDKPFKKNKKISPACRQG